MFASKTFIDNKFMGYVYVQAIVLLCGTLLCLSLVILSRQPVLVVTHQSHYCLLHLQSFQCTFVFVIMF